MSCFRIAAIVLTSSLLMASVASAQTDAEVNGAVQFNFTTPGARSLALGGAFLGLADDATAAFTNPAGITQLSKTEISIEGRNFDYSSPYAWGGHAFGPAGGDGVDVVDGIVFERSEEEITNLSFLSFVYPKGPWAVAVYTHLLADFEANFQTQGAFHGTRGVDRVRIFPIQASHDVEIRNTGVSFAYRFGKSFSVGVGLSFYTFDLDSLTQRFDVPDFSGEPQFTDVNRVNFQTQTGDDDDTGINLGFLWKISEKLSLGGAYREGPSFDVDARHVGGAPDDPGDVFVDETAEFNVPDAYGLGIALKPTSALTITLDWNRVNYSSLTEGMVIFFFRDEVTPENFKTDDVDEIHLGIEYVFTQLKYPLALRFGGWEDPDHKLRYEGDIRTNTILHFEGDDETHYSFGFGLVLGTRFQIDAAADFSDLVDTLSLSAVYRF